MVDESAVEAYNQRNTCRYSEDNLEQRLLSELRTLYATTKESPMRSGSDCACGT